MPTELERLKEGRKRKVELVKYFGFTPYSILRMKNPQINMTDIFNYQHETCRSSTAHHAKTKIKHQYVEATWSGKGIGRGKDTLSMMPPQLVDFFIKFYAKKGDLYFDPFAGQGVQLQVANLRGIDYIGYDICKDYIDYIESFLPKLKKKSKKLEIYHKDSKKIDLPNDSVDFCFTSPPYWDIEEYDNNPEQLGANKTYEEFLDGMYHVAKELFRVFKSNKYCVINVNDFRKGGRFYSYHSDTISLFVKAGWKIHDIWILDSITSGLVKIFAGSMVKNKLAPKIHEYALIFKK